MGNIMKNTDKIYEWVSKSRGDELPSNTIYSGSTHTDGHVYVARFNNIPGKVNLSNKKIYNFWVQAIGSQKCGEVLIIYTDGLILFVGTKYRMVLFIRVSTKMVTRFGS